jgi:hypothetical protein
MAKVPRISEPIGAGASSKKGHKPIQNLDPDVRAIQTMLRGIPADQGGTPGLEVNGKISGPGDPTVLAIRKFQQRKFGWQDGVVDPAGVTENTLQAIAGGSDDPKPPTILPLDIIVRFTGGPGGERNDEAREKALRATFNTDEYVKTHQPIEAICFTGFREQEKFVETAVADVLRRRKETAEGVTIVIGSSAGGVSALKAAAALTGKGIHLNYVGINDAAFLSSKNEVTFRPAFAINLATVLGAGTITADVKENFFQVTGHNFQSDAKSPTGFFPHAEFHGPLAGFNNVSLDGESRIVAIKASFAAAAAAISPLSLPVKVRDQFAATAHQQAGGIAENRIAPRVAQLVKP